MLNKPSESTTKVETQPGVPNAEKPNAFKETFGRIGNGMKEFGKSVFGAVKEVAKIPFGIIKGVDYGLSGIPLVGDIYGAGKGIVGATWGMTERIPVLGAVTQGLREGATNLAGEMFTSEEQSTLLEKQNMLLTGQEKDFIDRGKIQQILTDHPELKSHFDEYFKKIEDMKTGKESMSVSDLLKEGDDLEKKMLELVEKGVGTKKGDVYQNEYLDFKKSFPSLPEYSSLDKKSPEYTLLQNMYFSREPRPNLNNPIVKEFIQKSLEVSFLPNNDNRYGELIKEQNKFAVKNAQVIAQEFHMDPLEKNMMEYELNTIERVNRLPPTMPHEYNGDDYGLQQRFGSAAHVLFSENSDEVMVMNEKRRRAFSQYSGTILRLFQGEGH